MLLGAGSYPCHLFALMRWDPINAPPPHTAAPRARAAAPRR
eukprot:COSAG01_NODE_52655_length_345_cov_0.678862_1_plen_40_part_10